MKNVLRPTFDVGRKTSDVMVESVDFIVIGSGIAGLCAAIELGRDATVLVLTKDRLSQSNTEYAQGGIAVALSETDEISLHFQDTINAGAGLCDREAVRVLVEEGPCYINRLIEWGAQFDRAEGKLAFTQEAAHSRRRVIHAHGDSTGREIVRALLSHANKIPNITLASHAIAESLIVENGRCAGICYINSRTGQREQLTGRAVILATGGAGQLYSQTTNPDVATGDGMAMAYLAGAALSDMEFVQFHPTALNVAGAPRFLLTEAMRGEGGVLRNEAGELFMPNYHEKAELAPRDIVSRSIVMEMARTKSSTVYLDMTHLKQSFLRQRFPRIYQTCLSYGIDITRQPIPVSPAAHYIMGGVQTDVHGRTSLPGLYAAGEVACTGVHGANRLASNSLLEGLVFGARAGAAALRESPAQGKRPQRAPVKGPIEDWRIDEPIKQRVRSLMWEKVGIIRTADGLKEAIGELDRLRQRAPNRSTLNFITVACLIAEAALARQESRGAHYRADFPERNDELWQRHSVQRLSTTNAVSLSCG